MKHFFVAGFDFGTSYSKIVIRDQFSAVAKVVTFGTERSGLLPSCLWIGESLVAGPLTPLTEGILVSYPKLLAADAVSGKKQFSSLYGDKLATILRMLGVDDILTTAYFLLTRYFLTAIDAVHDFIATDEEWNGFDPGEDPLVVQLAVPTGLISKGDESVDKLMQNALATATILRSENGVSTSCTTVEEIRAAVVQLRNLDAAGKEAIDDRCITYPEVAAGVHTVLNSRNTPDGKYITIDVGAGTVDINVFLRRSRNDCGDEHGLDYWSCDVVPLGFARLNVPDAGHACANHEVIVNPLRAGDLFNQLEVVIGNTVRNAFRFQPFYVEGDGPSPWKSETYAYAWGGGAGYHSYLSIFLRSLQRLHIGVNSINLLPSPDDHFVMPQDLAGNFGRLAVAYGLSYHQANLEAVRLPHQLKSFAELHPSCWEFVSRTSGFAPSNVSALDRINGKLLPNYIPAANFQPAASRAKIRPAGPRTPSRYEVALETFLKAYVAAGEKMLIADRVRALNQIWSLCKRPEVNNNTNLIESALAVVNAAPQDMRTSHPVDYHGKLLNRQPRGYIQILRGSAQAHPYGCNVVVKLRGRHAQEEMEIRGGGLHLVDSVNGPTAHPRMELLCTFGRISRLGFFSLVALRSDASPVRPPKKTQPKNAPAEG